MNNNALYFPGEKVLLMAGPIPPPCAAELLESTVSSLFPVLPYWSQDLSPWTQSSCEVPSTLLSHARFSALLILDPWQTGHSGPPPRSPIFLWLPGCPLLHVLLSQLTLEPRGALPPCSLLTTLTHGRSQASNAIHMPTAP